MVLFDSQHEISTQLQLIAFRFVVSGNKFEAAVSAIVEVNTAFFDVLCGAMSLSFTRVWDGNDLRQR